LRLKGTSSLSAMGFLYGVGDARQTIQSRHTPRSGVSSNRRHSR
jgi:hypothetical protein